ncbi:MAG: hypothetical protein FWE80_07950, partial [Oscillospiraceae bacterium]|nr:hypothetical protein [Oscillospiraceae bacterium]
MKIKAVKSEQKQGGRHALSEKGARQAIAVLIWAVLGLIVPRASVYNGMAPFGVGLAAAVSGPGAFLAYFSAGLGYILSAGTLFPMRYVAAVATVAGIHWIFSAARSVRNGWLLPVLSAASATAIAGLAMGLAYSFSTQTTVMLVCESLIAGGFAWFCHSANGVIGRGA